MPHKDAQQRAAYAKAYRSRPEAVERMQAHRSNYLANHPERRAESLKAYGATAAASASKAAYRDRNREALQAAGRDYIRSRPAAVRAAAGAKHRAAKVRATPAWADLGAIKSVYEQCAQVSLETGVEHHVDHIYPLVSRTVCGLHVADNLQVITADANRRKGNRYVH